MKGYFRKRGDKWSFSIDVGRDPETSKRKQKTVSGFKTKKEAEKACAQLITEIEQGEYREGSRILLKNFIDEWLYTVAKPRIRPTTFASYEQVIRYHIRPAFGQYKLTDIKPMHVMRYYSTMLQDGYSENTIRHVHSILNNTFSTAVK